MTAEFSKQYPNVTFEVRADNFQNLAQNATKTNISSPDAPDLFRYPTVAAAAKAGILTSPALRRGLQEPERVAAGTPRPGPGRC